MEKTGKVININDYKKNKEKTKKLVLKKEYYKPKTKCVGIDTQKSPVMGCWDCGEDGVHC